MSEIFKPAALKKLRTDKGMTLKDVHEGTGIDGSTVSKYENGVKTPTTANSDKLAKFFKVDLSSLYTKTPDKVTEKIDVKKIARESQQQAKELAKTAKKPAPNPVPENQEKVAEILSYTGEDDYLSVPESPSVSTLVVVDTFSDGSFLVKMDGKFFKATLSEL